MHGIRNGICIAFTLQFCAALITFLVMGSPKYAIAATLVVAGISGLILWGFTIANDTGWCCTGITLAFLMGILWGIAVMPVTLSDLWSGFRLIVIGFVGVSWIGVAAWLWEDEQWQVSPIKLLIMTSPLLGFVASMAIRDNKRFFGRGYYAT